MIFTVDRDQFLEPLNRVTTVVDINPPLPILSQVLLQSEPGGIRLTGSNIQMEISELIPGIHLSEKCMFTFAGRTVSKFCNRLPHNCKLQFEVEEDMMTVTRIGGDPKDISVDQPDKGRSQIKTAIQNQLQPEDSEFAHLPRDFPLLEPGDMSIRFEIARSELHSLIRRTQHAMSIDDPRYVLNAMLFEIGEQELRTVTTDGHRMATSFINITTNLESERHRSIVPRKTVLDMNKLLGELSSIITIEFNNRHIRMSTSYLAFTSKLFEGNYPDWRGAVPQDAPKVLRVDRKELAEILARIDVLSELEKSPLIVLLDVDGALLRVHAESKMSYEQAIDEELIVPPLENPAKLRANCDYIKDVLQSMPESEFADFYHQANHGACVVKFPDEESALFVVMLLKSN